MLVRSIRSSRLYAKPITSSIYNGLRLRYKSNFHRPDTAGSNDAADAADATATILADQMTYKSFQIRPLG